MVAGATYDSALGTNLHVPATAVPNVRQLVNIVLDTMSSNYAIWYDLMLMALTRHSLADHVLSDDGFTDDPAWTRMDAVVLCWLTNTITADLKEVVRERGRPTRHLWLVLENQFLGNRETHTFHLDVAFRNFVQGDLSVTEYCCKFKGMADALADLGRPSMTGSLSSISFVASTSASSTSGPSSNAPRRSLTFLKFMMTFWRRSTWTPLGHPLLLRHSTPALRLRLLSRSLTCHPDRPTATTTRTRTTTATQAATVVATVARTTAGVVVMVVTLATPPQPPLDPPATMVGQLLHSRCTSTCGRGTSPCTLAQYLQDNSAHRPSWLRQVTTRPRDSCSSNSNSHYTSRPHLFLLQAGHRGMVRAGTSSHS
jgi:hypothetical protein